MHWSNTPPSSLIIHARGVFQVYTSCALVGNAPSILADPRTGAAIDRHEAVFRLNVGDTEAQTRFTGSKTTVRVLNREHVLIMWEAFRKRDDSMLNKYKANHLALVQNFKRDQRFRDKHWVFNFLTFCNMQYGSMRFTMRTLLESFRAGYTSLYYEVCDALAASQYALPPSPHFSRRKLNSSGRPTLGLGNRCTT